jgi:hypothetical protein
MNDPLKELFIEACGGHAGVRDCRLVGGWMLSDEELGKYAVSIVRECITQINEAIPDTDCSASGAYKTAKIAAMARVKDHFGVE